MNMNMEDMNGSENEDVVDIVSRKESQLQRMRELQVKLEYLLFVPNMGHTLFLPENKAGRYPFQHNLKEKYFCQW